MNDRLSGWTISDRVYTIDRDLSFRMSELEHVLQTTEPGPLDPKHSTLSNRLVANEQAAASFANLFAITSTAASDKQATTELQLDNALAVIQELQNAQAANTKAIADLKGALEAKADTAAIVGDIDSLTEMLQAKADAADVAGKVDGLTEAIQTGAASIIAYVDKEIERSLDVRRERASALATTTDTYAANGTGGATTIKQKEETASSGGGGVGGGGGGGGSDNNNPPKTNSVVVGDLAHGSTSSAGPVVGGVVGGLFVLVAVLGVALHFQKKPSQPRLAGSSPTLVDTNDIPLTNVMAPTQHGTASCRGADAVGAAGGTSTTLDHVGAMVETKTWAAVDMDPNSKSFRVKSVVRHNPLSVSSTAAEAAATPGANDDAIYKSSERRNSLV